MVVFAVPFSPRTRTPPTSGDTVVKINASAMSWEPTTAENGNVLTSHPSCGYPRPRHAGSGRRTRDATAASHGRRPDFPGLLLSDQLPESQWRDRSGLAPDSSAVAVPMMSHLAATLDPERQERTCTCVPYAMHPLQRVWGVSSERAREFLPR